MVYGTYNYSIHGVYKPSNITGGPHLVLCVGQIHFLLRHSQFFLCLASGKRLQFAIEHGPVETVDLP